MLERYQLRYAAGQYWLLDMEQEGIPYRRPMSMNGVGAEIWNMLKTGRTIEQMAETLSKEYQVEEAEIRKDIILFKKQLEMYGIVIGD